jgi:hypothetical protein
MPAASIASKGPLPRPSLGETQVVACTVQQIEQRHPGVQGRLRAWIHRADRGDPALAGLRRAVIRVGRTVLVDELRFVEFLRQRSLIPPAPNRRRSAGERPVGDSQ